MVRWLFDFLGSANETRRAVEEKLDRLRSKKVLLFVVRQGNQLFAQKTSEKRAALLRQKERLEATIQQLRAGIAPKKAVKSLHDEKDASDKDNEKPLVKPIDVKSDFRKQLLIARFPVVSGGLLLWSFIHCCLMEYCQLD